MKTPCRASQKGRLPLLSLMLLSTAVCAAPDASRSFTPEQQAEIGKIAAEYLVAHPDVLLRASQTLQRQKQLAQLESVIRNQQQLLADKDTPSVGSEDAKVAVIEFFDYQCLYCSKEAPVLDQVIKASPDVRFIFKEWPIFAGQWEPSNEAALRALAIWKANGPAAYLTYHNGIYATRHNEGKLTHEDIEAVSRTVNFTGSMKGDPAALDRTNALAKRLGLSGTPAIIVMPVKNATLEKTTVLKGAASADELRQAIQKAGE